MCKMEKVRKLLEQWKRNILGNVLYHKVLNCAYFFKIFELKKRFFFLMKSTFSSENYDELTISLAFERSHRMSHTLFDLKSKTHASL